MAAKTSARPDDQPTTRQASQTGKTRQRSYGTGQEPDRRGVHIPGSAPGQFTDLGPVSIPADAPRSQ